MSEDLLDTNIAPSPKPAEVKHPPIKLPGAGGILAMGIISIPLAAGIGPILGIVALATSGKPTRDYKANPEKYTPGSYSNLKAGKTCAIIGLSLTVLVVLLVIASNA
jgi:hypothetical protein